MKKTLKKRGQKFIRNFSRFSRRAEAESKEHIKENFFDRLSHITSIRLLIFEWGLLMLALILLGVTQAIWSGNSYSSSAFSEGGTYTEGTIGKVSSLNPLFATTESEKTLSRLLFSTITTVDYSGHVANGLAESITTADKGRTWTMTLKQGLKWSDGEPITNEDVLFTTSLIKNSAVSSSYDSNLSGVKVSETEDGKIQFSLPTAYADFASVLNIPLIPKHVFGDTAPQNIIEHSFSTNPITSGAFTLNAIQNSGSEKVIYLSANEKYYRGTPRLSSFAVHTYSDKATLIDALNSGAISATASIPPSDINLITSSNIREKQTAISSGVYAFLNTSKLSDRDLRRAIKQALDLDKIREAAPNQTPLDYPLTDLQIKIKDYPATLAYNREAAETKFNPLVNSENGFALNIVTVDSGYLPAVSNAIAEELRSYGIDANVSTYNENQEFVSSIVSKRNYDILVYNIELGAEPDIFAYYHSSQASESGLNLSNYKNTLIDDLILGARENMDQSLRVAKYHSFLTYWVGDVPAIGIYQPNISYFYNKNIQTFSDNNRLITALDRFTDVNFWASKKSSKNLTP